MNRDDECFDRIPINCPCAKSNLVNGYVLDIFPVESQQEQLKSSNNYARLYTGFCECESLTSVFRADDGTISCCKCKEELSR